MSHRLLIEGLCSSRSERSMGQKMRRHSMIGLIAVAAVVAVRSSVENQPAIARDSRSLENIRCGDSSIAAAR